MATRSTIARTAVAAAALLSIVGVAGCSTSSSEPEESAAASESDIPMPEFSQELQDLFPEDVIESGVIRAASITLPPYSYKDEDGTTDIGLNWDTIAAIEAATGLEVELEIAPSIGDIFTGFQSDRYDVNISPLSDIPATQANYDFAVWIAEYVVFIQPETAEDTIDSLDATCGHTIATLQGGTAQTVLENQQASCDEPIDIALFGDQDSAILAVTSGRADAAFSSQIPLTYYAEQNPTLVISGANSTDNGFPPFWVGASAPTGDPIVPAMLATFEALQEAGTYDALLAKYGIEENAMDEFGFNLAEES
ncbi:transporter substrate-binding domain-containing protein [Agrococcus jejuensis]|uniref:Amino acid ABC transporter substrate-binding protein, PAAT family n=1 Tax=Agrococcus jejuensis TaxID=399736 RepID=A0A1G8EFS3_9MICO|nr:transporter substrate-binding domain-containing protein [Agrococcus jejuensis]SDH68620.1 amino acid ABC transporter substrate-binding protein, PAAT family [Agrococcus jejuensis]